MITGATCMLGVALIEECIKHNVEVLAIVRKNSKKKSRLPQSDLIELRECELSKLGEMEIFPCHKEYDVFYHFAWEGTGKEARQDPTLQVQNIGYTLDAVKLAKRLGCKKFVGAGSQAEYGYKEDIVTPGSSLNPVSAYGIAKYSAGRMSERLCDLLGIVHIWARVFSVYGKNDASNTMVMYALRQFLCGEMARFSAATQMWDYLHESDAGKIFYDLGRIIETNKVYCVASGKSRPLKEYILEMQMLCGEEGKCEFANDENSIYGLQADVSNLSADIGFSAQISFKEGILGMIQTMREEE